MASGLKECQQVGVDLVFVRVREAGVRAKGGAKIVGREFWRESVRRGGGFRIEAEGCPTVGVGYDEPFCGGGVKSVSLAGKSGIGGDGVELDSESWELYWGGIGNKVEPA